MKRTIEKRRVKRVETLLPAIVTIESGESKRGRDPGGTGEIKGFRGLIKNIGLDGVLLGTNVRPELMLAYGNSSVYVQIKMRGDHESLHIPAKLVWARRLDGLMPGYSSFVGLRFLNNDAAKTGIEKLISNIEGGRTFYKRFLLEKKVYYGDTNVEGNVYFAKYFEWQGIAREEFYCTAVPNHLELLKSVRIITAEARVKFKGQLTLFDEVLIEVKTRSIKAGSLELAFIFVNKKTNQSVAVGSQTLAFADREGKVIFVPEEIKRSAGTFQDPYEDYSLTL